MNDIKLPAPVKAAGNNKLIGWLVVALVLAGAFFVHAYHRAKLSGAREKLKWKLDQIEERHDEMVEAADGHYTDEIHAAESEFAATARELDVVESQIDAARRAELREMVREAFGR